MPIKKCLSAFFKKFRISVLYITLRHFLAQNIYHPLCYLGKRSDVKGIHKQIRAALAAHSSLKGFVYIFQHSYYTVDGTQYISGGGERYACDLAELIVKIGYVPILFQKGDISAKDIWVRKHGCLTVIGIPGNSFWYSKTIMSLPVPALAIYSGYVDFGKKFIHPNILISHGITWDCPQSNMSIKHITDILLNTDCLVSVDTNTLSWLRTTCIRALKRNSIEMFYVPNYVDWNLYKNTDAASDAKTQIRILFPRRLCEERGFGLLCSVLPSLMQKYPDIIFDFVGFVHSEEARETLERLKVRFPGRILQTVMAADKMSERYLASDIVVIPTLYSEGTSLSCIEAMACGKAIIATNIGGLPNLIINLFNGLLINPTESELAAGLEKLICEPALRKILGENAKKVAEVFSKEHWNELWLTQLQKRLI